MLPNFVYMEMKGQGVNQRRYHRGEVFAPAMRATVTYSISESPVSPRSSKSYALDWSVKQLFSWPSLGSATYFPPQVCELYPMEWESRRGAEGLNFAGSVYLFTSRLRAPGPENGSTGVTDLSGQSRNVLFGAGIDMSELSQAISLQ
jgi:hypothetical protein